MNSKLWDVWLDFTNEVIKGSKEARKAFEEMNASPFGANDFSKWMSQWFPEGGARTEDFSEVVEQWWKTLGGVPRARYEEVEKQNKELWGRLKEAEATISQLRKLLVEDVATKANEQAQAVLAEWEKTTDEVLKAQAEFAQRWTEGLFGKKESTEKE